MAIPSRKQGGSFKGQQLLLLRRWAANPEASPFSTLPIDDLKSYSGTEEEGIEPYREYATSCLANWFLENFELADPDSTYDEYMWGGPFDARETIMTMFSDDYYYSTQDDELVDAVVTQIEDRGMEWVPKGSRLLEFTQEEDPRSAEEAYRRMQEHLKALEELLAQMPEMPTGIGHNHPPEPIDDTPLKLEDSVELTRAIAILETQPVVVLDKGTSAQKAASIIDSKQKKIVSWLARQGDTFATEVVKEAGKQFGRWMPRAFWLVVIERMIGVTDMLAHWLKMIAPHLS